MTRKPTTKSPEERRLRAQIRALLQVHAADQSRLNTDHVVREFLNIIDDEVRRARMSMAPVVQHVKLDGVTTVRRDMLPSTMTSRDLHVGTATPKAWVDWTDKVTCGGKQ